MIEGVIKCRHTTSKSVIEWYQSFWVENLAATMSSEIEQVEVQKEVSKKGKKAPTKDKAQEELGDVLARLTKVVIVITKGEKKFEEMDSNMEDLHEEMQGALNMVMDTCSKKVMERCEPLASKAIFLELEKKALKEEVGYLKEELRVLKDKMVLNKRGLSTR